MQVSDGGCNRALYKRLAVRFVLAILTLVFLFYVFPSLIRLLLPFIVALIVAAIISPVATGINAVVSRINKNINIPVRGTTLVLNLLVLAAVTFAIYYAAYTIVSEVIALSSNIQQNWPTISAKYDELTETFSWNLTTLPQQIIDIVEDVKDSILEFIQNVSKNIVSFTVSTTASGISITTTFLVNLITFFLALFFISSDLGRLHQLVDKYVSRRAIDTFSMLRNSTVNAVGGYLKAQAILALFAFSFMFIALRIYGQPYAFTIALFLGFIDLFPVIGTIAILLPWGAIEFIIGDLNKGVFLVLLGIVFFLVRKVIEPKVMGSQTGLPPLLVLLSTYVGLQVSGVWGAVLGPVLLMLTISVAKSGVFDNTVRDLKLAYHEIATLLSGDG